MWKVVIVYLCIYITSLHISHFQNGFQDSKGSFLILSILAESQLKLSSMLVYTFFLCGQLLNQGTKLTPVFIAPGI